MRRIAFYLISSFAILSLFGGFSSPANASALADPTVTEDEPDRVIRVDKPAPRVPENSISIDRSDSFEVKTSPISLLEYPITDGEHLRVIYTDGVVDATKSGACTVTTTAYTPMKKSHKAWVSGAFNRPSGCSSATANLYRYSGIVLYGSSSSVISANGSTVVFSATKWLFAVEGVARDRRLVRG